MKSQCKLTCNWLFIYFLVGRTPYSEMKRSEIELQVQTDAAIILIDQPINASSNSRTAGTLSAAAPPV